MNRRDFLITSGASILLGGIYGRSEAVAQSLVSIAEGKDYLKITKDAINAVGGISRFVKKGDVVVVKPNMGWDRKPEQAANTHPLVVRAVVEECLKAGAKKVKVFDRTCNDARRCYENSGIPAALKGMTDVDVKQVEDDRFRKVSINGVFLKEWELYDEVLSANVFINVPIAKHHSLSRLTLALKNVMGIMGGNRGYIHRSIEDALADVNTVVKSHLVVIDATRILTDHGPQGGSLKDVKVLNRVVVSSDIVAADAYATKFFNIEPGNLPITAAAYKRGLGEINLSKVKIVKA
jgi:uncharacterized protein (DUF362 family)